MKFTQIAAYLVLATALAGCGGGAADSDAALEMMLSEEIAFGQRSVSEGTRAAFLAYLADDSIVFQPDPADGKTVQME